MKMILSVLALLLSVGASAQIFPSGPNAYSGNLINQSALSVATAPTMDMSNYAGSRVSAQIVYSTVGASSVYFTDGRQSTASITIVTPTLLSSASATNNIRLATVSGLRGAVLNFNGTLYPSGSGGWAIVDTASGTAVNLAAAINGANGVTASASGAVVYATATYGTAANAYFFISNNSSMTVSALKFTGGRDNAVLTINGTALTQGAQWLSQASATATAKSLAAAINTAFSGLITSTNNASGSVVFATSTLNGTAYNYTLTTSTTPPMTVSGAVFTGGLNPGFTLNSKVFTSTNATGLTLGLPVIYSTGTSAIGGIVNATVYYAVPINSFSFYLAKCSSCATNGLTADYVTVTSTNSSTTLHTYTLAPNSMTGSGSAIWQASDDGSNWVSSDSVTFTSSTAAGSSAYDFGFFNFRYLRLSFTPTTTGGFNLTVPVYIKQDGIGRY